MRITIEADDKKVGETILESDDSRMLGHGIRAAQQRLQDVAQKPGKYVFTLIITKDDIDRVEAAAKAAEASAAPPPAADTRR